MKKILSIALCAVLGFTVCMPASAVVEVSDSFGNEYVKYDANMDGVFDVRDFVRVKKYYAGVNTSINLNFIGDNQSDSQVLVTITKEILKG